MTDKLGCVRNAAIGFAWGLLAIATSAGPAPAAGTPANAAPKWSPWLEFGGYWSSERSRGEVVLWSPLWQSRTSLLFGDFRGKLFEDDVREGNFALGFRQMLGNGWNVGIWSGFDIRSTQAGNTFNQASFGLEWLSENWDIRANGYLPLSDPKQSPSLAEVILSGNQIQMFGGREVPLHGVDGEIGLKIPLDGFLSSSDYASISHELRLYGGAFWFDASDALQEVAGPKARAEWRISNLLPAAPGSRLTLEAEWRNDDVRGTVWEVGARLRVPFSPDGGIQTRLAALTPQQQRMMEGIERDTDIVTAQSEEEPVEDGATGVDFDKVATVQSGGSVTATSNSAGGNTLIIANGAIAGAQTLQGNQTLQGGASTINVRGLHSGTVAGFTAPGASAILSAPGNTPNLTLAAGNAHVAGLNIQGAGAGIGGNDGISGGSGLNNVFIDQVSIANTGSEGIRFVSNNNVTVSGAAISGTDGAGIFLAGGGNTLKVANAVIGNTVGSGIISLSNNNNVAIENTTLTNIGGSAIRFGSLNTVAIRNTVITNTGDRAIRFNDGNRVTIADTSIVNSGQDGIFLGDNNIVDIARTTVTGAGANGIAFLDFNTVTIADTAVADVVNNGVAFENSNTMTMTGLSVRNTGFVGIAFTGSNNVNIAGTFIANATLGGIAGGSGNTLNVTGTTIANAGQSGIRLQNGNTVALSEVTIDGAGNDGLSFFTSNTVALNDSVLTGGFVADGVQVNANNNTLSGSGNSAANATFGGQFCNAPAQANGSFFAFDVGNCPP